MSGNLAGYSYLKDKLYVFEDLKLTPPRLKSFVFVHNSIVLANDFDTWHRRLGHCSNKIVKHVMNLCRIPCSEKNKLVCQACCLGKLHKLPFSISDSVYHYPLDLIYIDVWGPSPTPSKEGYRYYILFMDAHSKFTWLYFLHNRSQVPSIFIQFKTMVELQFNKKIKAFDDGPRNNRLKIIYLFKELS